jgi:hypothetical protein
MYRMGEPFVRTLLYNEHYHTIQTVYSYSTEYVKKLSGVEKGEKDDIQHPTHRSRLTNGKKSTSQNRDDVRG